MYCNVDLASYPFQRGGGFQSLTVCTGFRQNGGTIFGRDSPY